MSLPKLVRTINFRFALLYAAVFGGSVILLGMTAFWGVRTALEQQLRQRIEAEAAQLLVDYREDGLDELRHDIRERRESRISGRLLYALQSPDGQLIFDPVGALPPAGWHQRALPTRAGEIHILLRTLPLRQGYVLGIAADRAGLDAVEAAVRKTFAGAFLLTVVAALAGGVWLSRRFLSQIEAISTAAEQIGRNTLAARLPLAGTDDELDHLVRVINAMLARIEVLVGEVRQVSSGIAHDLRTPLGHVRQTLESALSSPDPAAPVAQAIAQLDTVLETFAALLRIAELEHGAQRAGFAPVNLSETVAAVAGAYRPVIEDHGQTLSLDVQPDVTTSGDRALIMQVCANLLDNAVRHAGHGARIAVTLSAARRGICLTVADTGPGVPALEYQNLTRPFYRLDPSRSSPGNGLGLSLVAAIARLHGWELQFAENGPGLRVILMAER